MFMKMMFNGRYVVVIVVNFIKYVVTVIMSIIVLVFSIYMIATNPENDNSIYFSLMSSILTLYIPAPSLDKIN